MATTVVVALVWLWGACCHAQDLPGSTASGEKGDSLTVSLITCYPGPEIYELCGHSAIRVQSEGRDSVWNYGIFDFNQPNFVYRFVKGETDYMGAGYPFAWFLPEYESRGSKVVEQTLNVTQPEAKAILGALQKSALPEYRTYRYNYVKDNCATRITDILDTTLSATILFPDTVHYGTFRNEMRHYHRNYPWYQFGIDICLGLGLDGKATPEEEMFVPVEMMRMYGGAKLSDGRPLVVSATVLNEGREDAVLAATPWYCTPLFVSWAAFLLGIAVCLYDFRKMRVTRWVWSLWFGLLGMAGILVGFLVFVSEHEATSPNMLLLWLNPFQLVMALCIWWRSVSAAAKAMALYDTVVVACMLLFWPFQRQSANPAFFPLMGLTVAMAATYAIISWKLSYNKKK